MAGAADRPSTALKHVAWLLDGPVRARSDGSLTSTMASIRYRCLAPVAELSKRGVQVSIFAELGRGDPAAIARDVGQRGVDIVVTGKPLGGAMVEAARLIRRQGGRVVADFCDDLFDDPQLGALSLAMARQTDGLVASTPLVAQALGRHLGRPATVISDPYEGPRGTPRFAPSDDRLELLWFGHDSNYRTLGAALPQLQAFSLRRPLRLTIVTALDRLAARYAAPSPDFRIEHVAWSPEGLWAHLAACDAVILPSPRRAYFEAKSPNRLVEAIWAGRAVAAHATPAHRDFASACWLGDGLAAALAEMIDDPQAVEQRIEAGQALIARRHAPEVIAAQWLDGMLQVARPTG